MGVHERDLLWTKLGVPPSGRHLVPRPQLLARVDAEPEAKLILLCAPAGFGKTTLLASWCHALREQDVGIVWIALDEAENDLARFLAYLTTASAELVSLPEDLSLEEAGVAGVLTQLINALATTERQLLIVLDDYHVINTPAVHAAVVFLLDHLPAQVRLALGARADPPLQLARLRVREQLIELRTTELRFSAAEVQHFFQKTNHVTLDSADAEAICAHVEGWPAGVQLISLALRVAGQSEPGTPNATSYQPALGQKQLALGQEHVFAYLAEEVFARQAPHMQEFLTHTAVLDRLSGPLCEAVLLWSVEQPFSTQQILEALDHDSLFITALDPERRWYRYHHLFRAFLLTRLAGEQPDVAQELYRRASRWCAEHNLARQAIEYALAGGDVDTAALLVDSLAEHLISRGEDATLQIWLDRLPEHARHRHPGLELWAAWTALLAGHVERVERPLARAVGAWVAQGEAGKLGAAAHLEAHLARLRGDSEATIDAASRALVLLPDDERTLRAGSLLALGTGQLLAGQLEEAELLLNEARAVCQAYNFLGLLIALIWQGDLALCRGQLRNAELAYQDAVRAAANRPIWGRWVAVLRLGELARERNALGQARTLLQEALVALEEAGTAVYAPTGYVALARTLWALGEHPGAQVALERGLHRAQQLGAQRWQREIRAWQARLSMAGGNLPAAQRWLQREGLNLSAAEHIEHEVELLTMARVLLADATELQPHPAQDQVHALLTALLGAAEASGRTRTQIELLILSALRAQATGNLRRGTELVGQALMLAEPEGFVRIFLDEGPPLKKLLRRVASSVEQSAGYATRLLALFDKEQLLHGSPAQNVVWQRTAGHDMTSSQLLVEVLSEREREVLLLVAAGASNQAIADALVISIGTVKSHLNHILGKLDADNRTAAVSRARALGLLSS